MVEQETQRQFPEAILNDLEVDQNVYLFVRFLEICSVLDYLQKKGILREENFGGKIIDLGTGSGIGLLALRQFSSNGDLTGIDNREVWNDINRYTGSRYLIPQQEIIKAALAKFERFNILDFVDLHWLSGEQSSLVTGFYANVMSWVAGLPKVVTGKDYEEGISLVFEEIGGILSSGGQLVFTSESRVARPSWAREEYILTGTKGKFSRTLELPFPGWLRERFWKLICEEKNKHFSGLRFFFEDEIFETDGDKIGLIRDMKVSVFTK